MPKRKPRTSTLLWPLRINLEMFPIDDLDCSWDDDDDYNIITFDWFVRFIHSFPSWFCSRVHDSTHPRRAWFQSQLPPFDLTVAKHYVMKCMELLRRVVRKNESLPSLEQIKKCVNLIRDERWIEYKVLERFSCTTSRRDILFYSGTHKPPRRNDKRYRTKTIELKFHRSNRPISPCADPPTSNKAETKNARGSW